MACILETSEGVSVVCNKELNGIWSHDETYEMELRILLLANIRMTISCVQFIHRRQGTMPKIYHALHQFCQEHEIGEMVVQSDQTPEMAKWCEEMGFEPIPFASFNFNKYVCKFMIKNNFLIMKEISLNSAFIIIMEIKCRACLQM